MRINLNIGAWSKTMAKKDGAFFGVAFSNETLSKIDHVALEIHNKPKIKPNRSKAAEYLIQLGYCLHRVIRTEGLIVKTPPSIVAPEANDSN
jgi:hypothetical protein